MDLEGCTLVETFTVRTTSVWSNIYSYTVNYSTAEEYLVIVKKMYFESILQRKLFYRCSPDSQQT